MTLEYEISEIEKIIVHKKERKEDCKFEEGLVKAWKKELRKQLQHTPAVLSANSGGV